MTSLLHVEGLHIVARRGRSSRTLVSSLDLSVAPGETVGIVGESGSGKSITARALVGLLPTGVSAEGLVMVGGRNLLSLGERELSKARGRDVALLLQDPFTMLNPLMRVGQQIVEGAEPGRRSKYEATRRLAEVGIDDPGVVERYPFQLSGGMQQRVALAAALASDPRILVADEPSTALDVMTQRGILALLSRVQHERDLGLVLITHDLRIAFSICQRIYVLYAGSLLEVAEGERIEQEPLHPYTLGLLLSEPSVERRVPRLPAILGSVPSADEVKGSCPFAARCKWRAGQCVSAEPSLREVAPGHFSSCLRIAEIRDAMSGARETRHVSAPGAERSTETVRPLLRVEDLFKSFGASGDPPALNGVSLEVTEGESIGLVGESGSGKTTLARCLLGLETPTSGVIDIDGIDASDYSRLTRDQSRRIRRSVQMIFQNPYSSLNPARSVRATLSEALAVGDNSASRVRDLLVHVGLSHEYESRKPAALSGGERQRVAIARALALRPRLIVCDEPVSALDVSVQAQILNLLNQLREDLGIGYLFITHDLAVVRQVADRIYVLHRGEVVESGAVDKVLDTPSHEYTARLMAAIPRDKPGWLDDLP